MIRVLQCVNNMHRAGLETMLMNYYRYIDRNEIQFDFLTHRPERSDYDDEIESLGGRVFHAPRLYPQNYAAYFSFMKSFFREHPEYQIVHSHIDSMSFLPLLAAKMAGIPIRIAHSHSTSIDMDYKYILKQIYRRGLAMVATDNFACGKKAGEFLFGSRAFTLIPNAIDADRFYYNEAERANVRKELKLEGKFVIGHVGRFTYLKNHGFLLEILACMLEKNENVRLLLIGTGEKKEEIQDKAKQMGLEEYVLFLGSRSDVERFYQAMDVFVMPSLFEGVPVVGIEAQFTQLPCVFSDRVPDEVAFTDLCCFVPLNDSPEKWAERIFASVNGRRGEMDISGAAYDIKNARHLLLDMYIELLNRCNG